MEIHFMLSQRFHLASFRQKPKKKIQSRKNKNASLDNFRSQIGSALSRKKGELASIRGESAGGKN